LTDDTKEQLYFPYFKKLMQIEQAISDRAGFNVNGAREQAPTKSVIFRQFLRDRLMLLKSGTITPFRLKWFNFSKNHYHFYKLNRQHGTVDRP
jgi:hypothetical protein